MISQEKIEEWVREVEARPGSAALIIQYISRRLDDLTQRNQELLAENISLRTERKVEEYETRITTLEYQLELLKRQVGGELVSLENEIEQDTISLVLFDTDGRLVRVEAVMNELTSGIVIGNFGTGADRSNPPRLVVLNTKEEALCVFDSGRTVSIPVSSVPAADIQDAISWPRFPLIEARGGEELSALLAIGMLPVFDSVVQASRRGCVKKMMRASFEQHLSKNYIGTGVKTKTDKTCCLSLCGKDDVFVLSSREGFMQTLLVQQMAYTTEDTLKLSATDYIVDGFSISQKHSILIVTTNGKTIHREAGWLEVAESNKSRGQAVFSPARREAGVRAVGAAAVDENDWCAALWSDGSLIAYRVAEVFASGTLSGAADGAEVIAFAAFSAGKK